MLGLAIVVGLNSALNTLCANAAGAKDYALCLVYLRRSQLALALFFIFIAVLMAFSE